MADTQPVVHLPRGGVYLRTSAGAVQFGLPPETIKDSMALGLEVPTLYVVPHEPFDRRRGVNLAECEFPAYYNFFILKRRIRLLVDDENIEARVRTVFQESLFGPSVLPSDEEFSEDYPKELRPDFVRESDFFRRGPDGTGPRLDVDMLVEFVRFDPQGRARFGEVTIARLDDGSYAISEGAERVASIPARIELPERKPVVYDPPPAPFEPPAFGVTVLGASHGFDPKGKTTGFILWVGHRGLLVDPPVDATESLREQGVPAKLIDGVILTHCHADHDSGAFQKLLEEQRINLYTTPTILRSFLKKYSSLSGLSESTLRRTFSFNPVQIGAPMRVHGAELWFFYTLHSIPAVGFEAFYGGKSLAFSSDTLYDPDRIQQLFVRGVLSMERCQDLLDFPWHHTVVLHEAGVPPLHTPVTVLAALPEEARVNLWVVHIAEKDIPQGSGLRGAKTGLANTLRIDVMASPHADAIDVLETITSVDIFRDFPLTRAKEFLHCAKRVRATAGTKLIAQGSPGDSFYIISSGVVSVVQEGAELRTYQAGDYFGETALVLRKPRNADVFAKTDVSLLEVDRYDFLYLLRGTDIPQRLVRLARMRGERSWDIFELNSLLRGLSNAQKTQLQSFLELRTVAEGELLWSSGESARAAYLLDDAQVVLEMGDEGYAALTPFGRGALLGDFDAMRKELPLRSAARVLSAGRVFELSRDEVMRFFQDNPGLLVSFHGARFIE